MNEREFEINGRRFMCSKIDAFKQFHIVRRMAPILADLLPVASKFAKMNATDLKEDQIEALAPIMNGIAKLSDVDADKVLIGLLSAVEIKQETGNWAKVAGDHGLMFQDLDLPTMLQAAGRAFMYNLSGFFTALPLALKDEPQKRKSK